MVYLLRFATARILTVEGCRTPLGSREVVQQRLLVPPIRIPRGSHVFLRCLPSPPLHHQLRDPPRVKRQEQLVTVRCSAPFLPKA